MQKIKLEKLFYNSSWKKPHGSSKFRHTTPGGLKVELPICDKNDIERCVSSASKGLKKYRTFSNLEKSKILNKISVKLKKEANILAKYESIELGKKFENAKKEIIACANLWRHASQTIKKEKIKTIKKNKINLYEYLEPVGIVALIIPWNFPMIVLSERLPYILAAGNSVIIKPSENGSLSINYFMKMLEAQKFPTGTINYILGNKITGKHLINNSKVSMISFTGSTKTGKEIYNSASKTIKRLSLELGGKNPMAVFSDADLNKTSNEVIHSFVHNAGQCCVSGSKLFIEGKIYKKFIDLLSKKLDKINTYQSTTTLHQYLKIKQIINKSIKNRTKILYRKDKLFNDSKRLIHPIIFQMKDKNNFLNNEEIFGPVLAAKIFTNFDELVKMMNDTSYGLSALIWTKNKSKALKLATKINFGRIWINGNISQNFPELSIGGFKESGLNRETGSSGLKTYSEIKSIIANS